MVRLVGFDESSDGLLQSLSVSVTELKRADFYMMLHTSRDAFFPVSEIVGLIVTHNE